MRKVICIGLNDKVPDGWEYIEASDVQHLLDYDFEAFDGLEHSVDVGWFKIINKNGTVRYLWLHWLGSYSGIDGNYRSLGNDNWWVRGVLIWK